MGGLSGPQAGGIFKAAQERGTVDAVHKFLEFIMDPKINAYWIHADPVFVPVTRATGYEPTFEESPIMNDTLDASGNNLAKYPFPKRSGRINASLVICDPLQKMIFEGKPAKEALAEANKAIADMIAAP